MKKLLYIAAVSAVLMACEKETIDPRGKEREIAAANAAKVVLPPSIAASKTYRCKDNSLVFIDWLSDCTARVKASKTEVGTTVKVGEAGTPSLTGTATAATVTYNGLSCRA